MCFCVYMCSLWFVRLGDIGWVVGVILSVHFGACFFVCPSEFSYPICWGILFGLMFSSK